MAESVDESDSKSDGSDTVRVQVPLWAPPTNTTLDTYLCR